MTNLATLAMSGGYGTEMLVPILIASFVGAAIGYVWMALALGAVFKKAGESSAAAWVPIYNYMVLARVAGYEAWMGLLMLVASPIMIILFALRINEKFRASQGFVVLALLAFPIWASILGWGKYRYEGAQAGYAAQPYGGSYAPPVANQGGWDATTNDINQLFGQQSVPQQGWDAAAATPAPAPQSWQASAQPQEATWAVPQKAAWPDQSDSWSGSAATPSDSWAAQHAAQQEAPTQAPAWQPPSNDWSAPAVPAAPPAPAAAAVPPVPPVPPVPAAPADETSIWQPSDASAGGSWQPPSGDWRAAAPVAVPAPEPTAPPQQRVDLAAQAGATRMSDDAEVVAQARAAMISTPPVTADPVDDGPSSPIVVPGPSGQLPGAPVSAAVPPPAIADLTDEWADSASVQPALAAENPVWTTSDQLLDMSADVSAVAGVADAGAPRSALSSVSASQDTGLAPLDDFPDDATEIAVRNKPQWVLITPMGAPVTLTADRVVLGRKPVAEAPHEDAQVVPVPDGTRTVSKTHALLELVGTTWTITDLGSTNGVVLFDAQGGETELQANNPAVVTERFLLGDAELRLSQN